MAVRVVILGEVRLFCDGLALLLLEFPRVELIGVADTIEKANKIIRRERPDILLLDMSMYNPLEAVRTLADTFAELKIVTLAVPETASDVVACAEAGAVAYVSREASRDDLIATLESATCGELRCSARVAASLLRDVVELRRKTLYASPSPGSPISTLTVRELEVLRLLKTGCSNKEIARSLGIEAATAKNHVHSILGKLGVQRRTHVISIAARWLPLAGTILELLPPFAERI